MLSIVTLIAGLVLLVFAGDYLVRGAVALAEKLSIDPLIIGLTVVAFGTSAPELFVSLQAAFDGVSGIAIGNIVGSNIANVLLVLGAPALLSSIRCREDGLGVSLVMMMVLTLVLMVMMWFEPLSRLDGTILMVLIGGYLVWQIRVARRHQMADVPDYHDEVDGLPQGTWKTLLFIGGGLVGLPVGAWLTVEGASHIARMLGATETAIGLTIVAVGTSLPELVTSVMAAWRKSGAVMIGNVVGSNIFNIGLILGGTSVILPLDVDQRIISIDMWVMFACGLLLLALAHWNLPLRKLGGTAMLVAFAIYIVSIF
ncbi:calcium/sodium antiporter [Hoeflea olei]|uniref:Sodium:proton exchanger n=1 Tax=Hoeflea olei TaxID=1480615 RepID=A0A1C1YQJ5_9HYPH|nr:calcium/sodium antiporter [Hoeflea olei]OCW55841.1 sodium:proton exchanger [Hoeflea olei]